MFGKKKKRFNAVFGNMKYGDESWYVDAKIILWDRTYNIGLSVDAKSENDNIENQEKAYEEYKKTIIEMRKEIEEIIEGYYLLNHDIKDKQVLISEFDPLNLIFKQNGECVLMGFGPNDPEEGFALMFVPKLAIMNQFEYLGEYYLDE